MGRTAQPFKLTPAEAAALDAARVAFIAWHEGLPTMRPKPLADLRKAARALHKALRPVLDGHMNPTAARLLVRMQETELCQQPQSYYADHLTLTAYTLQLIDRACASDVRRGRKADERATWWIRAAADQWRAAGLPVAARGRFGKALSLHRGAGIPDVTSPAQIAGALQVARE